MQKRVGKIKSIFQQIEGRKNSDGNTGMEEITHIYMREALPVNEQAISANLLCGKLIKCFKEDTSKFSFDFKERPLITFSNVFINKMHILVQEDRVDLEWIKALTKNYVFESDNKDEVKLGLILAEKYLSGEDLKKAVDVFTKSGQYIFYLTRAIKNIKKCNTYIMELLKKSKGTIKIFALTNLEILSEEINTFLFEEGYKDKVYEEILIEYVLASGNIKAYLKKIEGKQGKINRFSYLIYTHLKSYKLKDSPIKYALLLSYLPTALKGSSYLTLVCIVSLWKQLLEVKELKEVKDGLEETVERSLNSDKWERVFFKEMEKASYKINDIIEIAEYYEVKLSFEELYIFLKKTPLDLSAYLYITMIGKEHDKLELLKFFSEIADVEALLKGAENINTKDLKEKECEYIILALLINGCREVYPEGKDLAIKGLTSKTNDVRNEAIKVIKQYKEKLTLQEKELIKLAMEREPNYELRSKLKEICQEFVEGIIEFISTRGLKTSVHVKDIYLLQSMVARSKYRNKAYLKRELKSTKVFNLVLESDNPYDKNAIKIVGESGFVIGYVPKKDNFVLSNLLRGGRYLYCKIMDYNLDNNYISIKVYLSYKNIVKEAETLIQMMTSDGGDFEN